MPKKPKSKSPAPKNNPPEPKPSFQGIALLAQALVEQRLDLAEDTDHLLRADLQLPPSGA